MSLLRQLLRRDHFQRFVTVARRDGMGRALRRANSQIQILRRGGARSEIAQSGPSALGRFIRSALWADLSQERAFFAPCAPALSHGRRSVALIGDLNLPQCRKYRVEQMAEFWSALGVDYRFAHVEDVPRCLNILQEATHLVLYRVARSDHLSMYLYEARRLKLPIVYDIDDPIFSVPALAGYSNLRALGPDATAQHIANAPLFLDALSMADAVTVSTPGLAAEAEAFTSRPVWLRRNFADQETLHTGAAQVGAARYDIALVSGSRGRAGDAALLQDALNTELESNPKLRLLVLGHTDGLNFSGQPEQLVRRPFTIYSEYLRSLSQARVVCVPLSDDAFNGCKSAVRALDAAAVGRPVIASPVGDLPMLVRDGVTGRLAATQSEWQSGFRDTSGWDEMGRAARAGIEQHWTVQNILSGATSELGGWVVQ